LLKENGELIEMSEQGYDSEDLLQTFLAKYPNLMAGDQIDSINPRKWLLISREMVLSSYWGTIKWIRDSNIFSCRAGARHPLPLAERLGSKQSVVGPENRSLLILLHISG
jgi:hypothetical protein